MNHNPGCTDSTVIVQPQLARRLPVIARCIGCDAVEVRTPTRHRPGEGCKCHVDQCCEPDNIPRQWKPLPVKKNAPRPNAPTPTAKDSHAPQE